MKKHINMMIAGWTGILVLTTTGISASPAADQRPTPNWHPAIAGQVLQQHSASQGQTLKRLSLASVRAIDSSALQQIADDPTLAAPVRDQLIHEFTLRLAGLEPSAVDAEVLDWLAAYQPQTLIPHDDIASVGVPLFDVAGALMAVKQDWQRHAAFVTGTELLARDATFTDTSIDTFIDTFIDTWAGADRTARRGLREALTTADPTQLSRLAEGVDQRLRDRGTADGTGIGELAVLLADRHLPLISMDLLIRHGDSAAFSRLLGELPERLSAAQAHDSLVVAAEHGYPGPALAALGRLAPQYAPSAAYLLRQMNEVEVASAAAMALAGNMTPALARYVSSRTGKNPPDSLSWRHLQRATAATLESES